MKQFLWGIVLPLVGFFILAITVAADPVALPWDTGFLLNLHRYATPEFNRSMAIATRFGTTWGVFPSSMVIVALWLWHQRWRASLYLTVAILGSMLLNPEVKNLWHRARPALWEGIPPHTDFSFPSGHAMHSMVFVAALMMLNWDHPRRRLLFTLGSGFVLMVGFTRVYLGVHYPSDILGGWLLAIAWVVGLKQVLFFGSPDWSPRNSTQD